MKGLSSKSSKIKSVVAINFPLNVVYPPFAVSLEGIGHISKFLVFLLTFQGNRNVVESFVVVLLILLVYVAVFDVVHELFQREFHLVGAIKQNCNIQLKVLHEVQKMDD